MLIGLAHTAVCVPDVDAAVAWYTYVLGLELLSPPYQMDGDAIAHDMGELLPAPVVVKAAIVGFGADDRVIELIEYPNAPVDAIDGTPSIAHVGTTHIGLVCDDVPATRAALEARGVEFLTAGNADIAGLQTTWCRDPWGTVLILLGKRYPDRPYWRQYGRPVASSA